MKYLIFVFLLLASALGAAESRQGAVVTEHLVSSILRENRIGLNPERVVKVYLPPSYATSDRSYPVVYFCHTINWSAPQVFADGNMARRLERAFDAGVVGEFILVAADYTNPAMGSLYENSPVTGRWLDYTVQEVVPLIDRKFRTIARRESRAVIGDFMGGRGALKLAMTRPDIFGSVYALHPVATGWGRLPLSYLDIDWAGIHGARSLADVPQTGRTRIFLAISQAFLPNPDRLPFHCDFPMEMKDGRLQLDPANIRRMQQEFLLEESLDRNVENLHSLRGLAFDWGRFDPTQDHVFSNTIFSRKLTDLGVPHEAEEFAGNPWDKYWGDDGRFTTRVLPFLARHLEFAVGQ
jgi:pimeloyl-ACP methyl ester carboxylesterase